MRIDRVSLERLTGAIFAAAGCSAAEAARIAESLVKANLAGHDSHGVIRVPRYVKMMRDEEIFADRRITVVNENDVMAVVDGNLGFGQTVGPQAVELGINKAAKHGVAVIALRRAGHLGCIGDWAEMAADAGLISLNFVNVSGSLLVAPFGAVERRLATNPVAIGVPRPGEPHLILDFATSVVAEGKVLVALGGGKALPEGSLIDDDGNVTTDPSILYGFATPGGAPSARLGHGAIRAMAEHKGSGLSLMCELLAGALTGSGCTGPGKSHVFNGMLSVYLDAATFDSDDYFAAEVRRYLDFFQSAKPTEPGGEVLLPGDVERRNRAARLAQGIPLTDDAWSALVEIARAVSVAEHDIAAPRS